MRLASRISRTFLWIIALAILSSAATGVLLTVNAIRGEAISRVEINLTGARSYLEEQIDLLMLSAEIIANGFEGRLSLPVEPDITVISPGNPPLSFMEKTGAGSEANSGFIILDHETAEKIGIDLDKFSGRVACSGEGLLCFFALFRGSSATAFTAVILNENFNLVRHLQATLFGEDRYRGKPFGTVTIFCNDLRVATTVLGPAGEVAVGTRVSDEVRIRVLEEGGNWLQRAFVVDEWYLSAYEPIKNPGGENIGILYVGVIEKKYVDLRNKIIIYLALLSIPALALVFLGSFIMAKRIVQPLLTLSEDSRKIASGSFDVTILPEKEDEEIGQLAGAFVEMAGKLENRDRMLSSKNIQLEERNRDYQELLSFVTHELNNSIGSLLLNVSILADGSLGELAEEPQEVAVQILHDVQRFKDMVKNYLNLSRLEKGTLPYDPGIVDIRTMVIEPILKRFDRWISHRNFKVEWDWDERFLVYGDQNLLDIAFSNLFVNALKYGEEFLRIHARSESDGVIISLTNGGPPIPTSKIPLLFRKFSRLVKSDDGVGLGLYLVKEVIERQKGEVWCEADEQSGTSFSIKLNRPVEKSESSQFQPGGQDI